MIKYTTNEKGSALIFTILIVFIVSILGTTLVSVAFSNFRLSKHGNDYNTVYYLADGAAEEVISEIDIVTQNAEYESLSLISAYADAVKDDYADENENSNDNSSNNGNKKKKDDEESETTYTYRLNEFEAALKAEFEENYRQEVASNLQSAIEEVEFAPSFGNNFEETISSSVILKSPNPLEAVNISNGDQIVIEVTGHYNDMKRIIRLTFAIDVPSYAFNASGSEENLVDFAFYDGYERSNQNENFELIHWEEIKSN